MAEVVDNTILSSVKEALGIPKSVEVFDGTLLMHINSVVFILRELGVGPNDTFNVSAETAWTDYLEDSPELELVKSDMYLRVRLLFDPPATSFVLDSIKKQIEEFEWRLNAFVDPPTTEET